MEIPEKIKKYNVNMVGSSSPVMVMEHGFGSDQTAFRHLVEFFCKSHRVVLFDYIGCGKTDPKYFNPIEYNSIHRYSDDLLSIYEELNLKKVFRKTKEKKYFLCSSETQQDPADRDLDCISQKK